MQSHTSAFLYLKSVPPNTTTNAIFLKIMFIQFLYSVYKYKVQEKETKEVAMNILPQFLYLVK